MSRVIKFRAWHKDLKEMFTVAHLHFGIDGLRKVETSSLISDTWTLKDIELMQFTGLLDKHGKEIYEGDLVRWSNITHEIQWHGEFGWIMKDDRDDWDCPSLYTQELVERKGFTRVEVVGNIYVMRTAEIK